MNEETEAQRILNEKQGNDNFKRDFKKLAELHKIMYDSYMEQGFSQPETMMMIMAHINKPSPPAK